MTVSSAFHQAIKYRKQRARRMAVLLFFVVLTLGLSDAGEPFRWGQIWGHIWPFLIAAGWVFRDWKWRRTIPVSSLDDRAIYEFGAEFDKLTEAQQHDLLRRYRVGTYLMNYFPDELQVAQEAEAHVKAYRLMRLLLPPLVMVYCMGWLWLPLGRLRAGWTDAPTLLAWLSLLLLALPQMISMWTEPDDLGEPRIAEQEA